LPVGWCDSHRIDPKPRRAEFFRFQTRCAQCLSGESADASPMISEFFVATVSQFGRGGTPSVTPVDVPVCRTAYFTTVGAQPHAIWFGLAYPSA
jgi:hypothetical protein